MGKRITIAEYEKSAPQSENIQNYWIYIKGFFNGFLYYFNKRRRRKRSFLLQKCGKKIRLQYFFRQEKGKKYFNKEFSDIIFFTWRQQFFHFFCIESSYVSSPSAAVYIEKLRNSKSVIKEKLARDDMKTSEIIDAADIVTFELDRQINFFLQLRNEEDLDEKSEKTSNTSDINQNNIKEWCFSSMRLYKVPQIPPKFSFNSLEGREIVIHCPKDSEHIKKERGSKSIIKDSILKVEEFQSNIVSATDFSKLDNEQHPQLFLRLWNDTFIQEENSKYSKTFEIITEKIRQEFISNIRHFKVPQKPVYFNFCYLKGIQIEIIVKREKFTDLLKISVEAHHTLIQKFRENFNKRGLSNRDYALILLTLTEFGLLHFEKYPSNKSSMYLGKLYYQFLNIDVSETKNPYQEFKKRQPNDKNKVALKFVKEYIRKNFQHLLVE